MTDILNMEGYLLAIDIEKAFDSVDHYFLLAILKKCGFKKTFLILFQVKERDTPRSFDLCALVYSSISIILVLKNIKDLNIFNHEFLDTAYANDNILFLKDKISVFETVLTYLKKLLACSVLG